MKRKPVFCLFGLLVSLAASAQPADTWVNYGVITAPPDLPPQIDAVNFINSNSISIFFTNFTVNPELFDTSDTLHFTNTGSMLCSAGWQFDTAPAISGLRHPALSLYNSGSIFASSGFPFVFGTQTGLGAGTVLFGFNFGFGGAKIIGSADYIFNSGVMQGGFNGLVRLTGGDLSLSRGEVSLEAPAGSSGGGLFDNYWGARTNISFPAFQFDSPVPFTSLHTVTQLLDHIYFTTFAQLALNNPQTWVNETIIGTNRTVQIVLLSEPNPAISNNVYFFAPGSSFDIGVEWIMYATNLVTGDIITNYLSAGDGYFNPPTTNNFVMTNNIMPGGAVTFIPTNFFVQPGQFFSFFGGAPAPRSPTAGIFSADLSLQVTNEYGAYSALVLPFSMPTNDVAGRYPTNLAGRVELSASRVMDLNRTRMANLNVVSLKSTNHFAGNTNAQIAAAFWDLDLATTNSSITISNLLMPLSRMNGVVNFYRARWTNQTPAGAVTNTSVYHVLFVDSQLTTVSTPQVTDFLLRNANNTDVVISDELDVMRNFQINARNLTLTSNTITDPITYPSAFYPVGSINIENPAINWSTSLPNLRNLTNHGFINIPNGAFFGGQRSYPFFSSGPADWYDSFINDGSVTAQGLAIYSRYLNSSGLLDSGVGPLSIYAGYASITNGTLFAVNSSVNIFSGSLVTSNSFIDAGSSITLSITNYLDDGSLANCVQFVTNKNVWLSQGFSLLNLPPLASLLATTVTNSTLAYHQVVNKWAGADKGTDPIGYVNNAAVGQLILDGGHPDSLFSFVPANGNNALYVDSLELKNYATNNANNVYYGIDIQPGMVIYYAQATENGVSIAEKLNGANFGRFRWVSNYNCGFFSSVTLTNPIDGTTYTMNGALRESQNIDSDADSIVNRDDPTPLGSSIPTCNCPPFVVPPFVVGGNPGDFGPGSTSSNVFVGAPTIQYPGAPPQPGPVSQTFADVQGSYVGLFSETNGVSATTAGYFSATTTKKGAVSAKFVLGGRTYSFSGTFDANGIATGRISRGALHALNVRLQLDLSGGNQITGSITDSHWTSQVIANRLVFDKSRNPATHFVGTYTLDIPGDAPNTGRPSGDGFGTVKIDSGANVQFAGALADGTKITQKTTLSSSGVWPFYASLYQGNGCALGWVELVNHRLAGQVAWVKSAGAASATKNYSAGFTNRVDAAGLSYAPPARDAQLFPWNYGQAILNGGGVSGFWTNSFYLDLPARKFVTDNSSLKLSVTPSSGLFQGSIVNPNDGKQIKFQGVLFQDINVGLGYFLNSDQSGQIYLGPAP